MHEGEMPEKMVLEVAEVITGIDVKRQKIHAADILAPLVEHVGHGVHGPGVPGIHGNGLLGQRKGLVEAAVLLEGEGVVAEHEAVRTEGGQHRLGQFQHLGGASLPEVDVVETLHQHHVTRVLDQALLDQPDRVGRATAYPQGEGLHVAALPEGQRGRGGRRPVHLRPPVGDPLREIEGGTERGPGQHEVRIGVQRGAEAVDDVRAETEQPAHPAVIGVHGGPRAGRHGIAVEIRERHGGHPSRWRRRKARARASAHEVRPTKPSRKPAWPPSSTKAASSQRDLATAMRGSAEAGMKGSLRALMSRVGRRIPGRNCALLERSQ
jgi:hypothetical protein